MTEQQQHVGWCWRVLLMFVGPAVLHTQHTYWQGISHRVETRAIPTFRTPAIGCKISAVGVVEEVEWTRGWQAHLCVVRWLGHQVSL